MSHFKYTRIGQVAKKDENGNAIPLKDDKGNVIKGKFETEEVAMTDTLNLDKVIRTHMINPEHIVVLLDDGHESLEKVPGYEKNKIVEKNQRIWVQSEISIKGEDVQKYFEALGV